MLLRVGPQLKPFSSYRRVRWREGAPLFWAIADQGGAMIDAADGRLALTNHGGITNSAGPCGPALSFNGTTGYVSLGSALAQTGSFTVSARVYPTVSGNSKDFFTRAHNGGSFQQNWILDINSSLWRFQMYDGTNIATATSASGPTLNAWSHVCGVCVQNSATSVSLSLYVNGVKVGTGSGSTNLSSITTQTTNIGCYDTNANFFPGAIDDVRVYNYPLTALQVLTDYLDPWWRLRHNGTPWMGQAGGGGATVHPWWTYVRPMMGALGSAS